MDNLPLLKRALQAGISLAVLAAAVLAAGCSEKREVVVPAPNAFLGSEPQSAAGSDQGVKVVVETNSWDGYPRELSERVIVLKVTIENHSPRPVEIRYNNLSLTAAHSHRYSDIPPYGVSGRTHERLEPEWAYSDAEYFSVPLPTEEMIQKAIAEGTIAAGQTTTGFLYFQKPPQKPQDISFRAILVDAQTGERFGRVEVPLLVKPI